jgi:TPR repeat protein
MRDPNRNRLAIEKLKNELRRGSLTASNNIAATYREHGNLRRAFQWWRRTAGPRDGDAWLEVGYCLQYGIGTRRDAGAAIRAYRHAITLRETTDYGKEEARYHLAVALLDRSAARHRKEIERLLRRAGEDGDYPRAIDLFRQLSENRALSICRCRRGLSRRLGGKAQCELHRGSAAHRRV